MCFISTIGDAVDSALPYHEINSLEKRDRTFSKRALYKLYIELEKDLRIDTKTEEERMLANVKEL